MQKRSWILLIAVIMVVGSACRFSNDLSERILRVTPTKSELTTGRSFPTLVTLTATNTATEKPTSTATATVTATWQFSPTPTRTSTKTARPTFTMTSTKTVQPTFTITATKTAMPTPTITKTPTRLPTETPAPYATKGGCDGEDMAVETELIGLINAQRTGSGVESVTRSSTLSDVARSYSRLMAENGFFDHGDITSRINPAGEYSAIAEILYAGMGPDNNPSAALNAWLNSPVHRENLFSPVYTLAGVGYWCDPSSTYGGYYTVDFARE